MPGDYLRDYAQNPYKYSQSVVEKIDAGTYQFFWPPGQGDKRTP